MACYHPILGYRSRTVNENGKREIVFNPNDGYSDMCVQLPCGQCIGCRLERSRQWAIRCVHEASLHDQNCFITLTYSNDKLPDNGSLVLEDWQKFIKRLRKSYSPKKIRYFMCGEYGERFHRPHYHACLFGFDFPDRELFRSGSVPLYRSSRLEGLWPFGFSSIGNVSFESAAYVARYITKKVTGDKAAEHYDGRKPEFTTMSRRPGIGSDWIEKFETDVYPFDEVIIRGGVRCMPPRFYDQAYESNPENELQFIKAARYARGKRKALSLERLGVIEQVKLKTMKGREYEKGII